PPGGCDVATCGGSDPPSAGPGSAVGGTVGFTTSARSRSTLASSSSTASAATASPTTCAVASYGYEPGLSRALRTQSRQRLLVTVQRNVTERSAGTSWELVQRPSGVPRDDTDARSATRAPSGTAPSGAASVAGMLTVQPLGFLSQLENFSSPGRNRSPGSAAPPRFATRARSSSNTAAGAATGATVSTGAFGPPGRTASSRCGAAASIRYSAPRASTLYAGTPLTSSVGGSAGARASRRAMDSGPSTPGTSNPGSDSGALDQRPA